MGETKEHYISFRVTDDYFHTVKELSDKLGLDRSETIRLFLDKGIEKYLGKKSSLLVVDSKKWDDVVTAKLEGFKKNFSEFREYLEILLKQVKPKGAKVQEEKAKMTTSEVGDFLKVCMKEVLEDYDSFSTEDSDPDKKTIREAVKRGIGRAKGKVF